MDLKMLTLLVLIALAVLVVAVVTYGAFRWRKGTREVRARLEGAREPIRPAVVDLRELDGLPPPVGRYFRQVLRDGQPLVAGARVRHRGTFNLGEAADRWKPFTSDQTVVTRRPGFDWDGRIAMLPGFVVRVRDAYVEGEGVLLATLFGLLPLADLRGGDAMARGELMRFFAEAAWYPTALLPSQGVRWEAVDDRSARGTLTDGPITVTLLFTFDEEGLIDTVSSEARGRTVDGEIIPTPWQGRFWSYEERGGMRVPLDGEVAWLLPEGAKPYWRGRIVDLDYDGVG